MLDALEREYAGYLASQPYTALHDVRPTTGRIITRLIIDDPVPVRLSVLFGEVAHQARSALDHLVCRLVEARGKPLTRRTSFPVMRSAERWDDRVRSPTNAAGDRMGGPLAGLDPGGSAWQFIHDEQPFHADDSALHPLEQLDRLWNTDKHRNVSVCNTYVDPAKVLNAFLWTPPELQPEQRVAVRPLRPIKSGEVLAVHTFGLGRLPDDFSARGPIDFEVAFGDADGKPRPSMRDTVAHVVGLVARAAPLLEAD